LEALHLEPEFVDSIPEVRSGGPVEFMSAHRQQLQLGPAGSLRLERQVGGRGQARASLETQPERYSW
jgi:hypothetical protein